FKCKRGRYYKDGRAISAHLAPIQPNDVVERRLSTYSNMAASLHDWPKPKRFPAATGAAPIRKLGGYDVCICQYKWSSVVYELQYHMGATASWIFYDFAHLWRDWNEGAQCAL